MARLYALARIIGPVYAAVFSSVALTKAAQSLSASFIHRKDLFQDWLMARALAVGVDPYRPVHILASELSNATGLTFDHASPHPPSLLPLLRPLGAFEYRTVATAWIAFEVAALAATAVLLRRLRGYSRALALVLFLAVLGSDSSRYSLVLGQFGAFIALLTAAFVVAQREKRFVLAGSALGLALVIKFWGAPLLLWLALQRQWRTIAAALLVAALFHAASLVFLSPAAWLDYYLHTAPEVARQYVGHAENVSLSALSPWLTLGLLGIGAAITLRHARAGLIMMLFLTPVVSPIAWLHGVLPWVVPFCMTLSPETPRRVQGLGALAVGLVLIGMTPAELWPAFQRPLYLLPVFVVMAYALFWATQEARSQGPEPETP
ncbi:MAG: glycosyltransferase family 87 protein [Myxococcota bacterium]